MKLLLAEDDSDMARAVMALLTRSKYTVDHVSNGNDALDYLLHGDYDAAILDIMMPEIDGVTVLQRVREKGSFLPVMMLTAMGEIEDRIHGLDAGADDYLTKPFDSQEFLARVRALLRRNVKFQPDIICYGDLQLNRNSYELTFGDKTVSLGSKAFQMMEMFMLTPNKIISVDEFMGHIWGWDSDAEVNVVWVNISYLRKQLAQIGSNIAIHVVRGAGYKLEEADD